MRQLARIQLASVLLLAVTAAPADASGPSPGRPGPMEPAVAASPGRPAGAPAAAAARRRAFAPGRVLVGFRSSARRVDREVAAAAVGGREVAIHGRTQVLALPADADVRAAARELTARPGVAFAEPDWLRRVDGCGDGVDCWHLGPAPSGVNAVAAQHDLGATGTGATVAVIDTGVGDLADLHLDGTPGAADRVTRRVCVRGGCRAAQAGEVELSHGTEVASLIAAADDGRGITGVAPEAAITSYRVDAPGSGGAIPVSAVIAALTEIAGQDTADVVNLSLGGPQWSVGESNAVQAVLEAGIPVVASAGNDGNYVPSYPAAYHGVVSVGATTEPGQVAAFSAYGKVDVVAPGACVPVAKRPGATDQSQRPDCPDDPGGDVHLDSGTSFAAPIVAGTLALAANESATLPRLAVQATAHPLTPGDLAEAKPGGHGLVDAGAFVAAHGQDAPTLLTLETLGPPGSGDGQLPHPDTVFIASAFKADGSLPSSPGSVTFAGAAASPPATETLSAAGPGVFAVTRQGPELPPGTDTAMATIAGTSTTATVVVRVLRDDDQAPGVPLSGSGDDAWRRLDGLQSGGDGTTADDDVDDVYAVVLRAGDVLDAAVTPIDGDRLGVVLYDVDTTDVFGEAGRIVACGGGEDYGCPTARLGFTAPASGTYLLDVYAAAGPTEGDYWLSWTVRNRAGLPVTVPVPACSPNGDGIQERCAWTANGTAGFTVDSFITKGTRALIHLPGTGARSWGGHDERLARQPDGAYWLRIRYLRSDGRALLRAYPLVLDRVRPRIAEAADWPDPFEPRPHDGDRDTVTFAMTSSEAGRLRIVVDRGDGTTVVRWLTSGRLPAGRQRITWSGRSTSGRWLHGRFSYTVQATDAAGNAARSGRHPVTIA